MEIIAKTFQGLEEVLAEEIKNLGGTNVEILNRAVKYQGDTALLYKSNYLLRTALRVITPIRYDKVLNENQLYKSVYNFPWEEIFSLKESFSINPVVNSTIFRHSQYAALKAKDAIADRFRDKFDKRPNVNPVNAHIQIDLHIRENQMTIFLDSSGFSLHMRGYRMYPVEAPLNEVMAAGLILLSGWDKKTNFIDPMCGSGTLLIEAARMALNRPAHRADAPFSFKNWSNFDKLLWDSILQEAEEKSLQTAPIQIIGSDKSLQALRAAETNVVEAGLAHFIKLEKRDLFAYKEVPTGLWMTNPPYDERLKLEDDIAFYKQIGDWMKHNIAGSEMWVFSGNIEALKSVGLRPSKKIKLMNGPIEAGFHKFEIYEGSK